MIFVCIFVYVDFLCDSKKQII